MSQSDWIDWLYALGILLLFLLFRKVFTSYLFALLLRWFKRSKGLTNGLLSFEKPLRSFFVVLGVFWALHLILPDHWPYFSVLNKLYRNVVIILVGWGFYNLSAKSSNLFAGLSSRLGLDESSMLIPFLSKILRFIVVVLVITMIISEWGYSINGLVAGLGLGSLAIAMAAKDTLSNFLAGIIIITEKPFSKGDWILTPDIEGVVEDITFRSSKIRTFANALVTVPNATLADRPITNWSRMGKRRITFTLGVALDSDRPSLQRAVSRIERRLREDEAIHQETIMVHFTDFNESSLGIYFYLFTKSTVWAEHLQIRQDVNFMIMEVLEEEGVALALPSQRLFVESASGPGRRRLADET
ncbi:mechanosensitive ion channel family protein [Paenibacillus sp. J2TS4]|uniref:mechanosensitive ion channel family protein n=1 Tax=Paenibacillus sp. J2TS4 TaxID=2807194 RepID=UPI001B29614F|nr:mechanosensitive ion channel family protein [Paenibacillus sp. J2TS4]GIP35216.1 putative MscS family protein YhdY [Paenibacillus sp. J2TS4]